MNFALTQLSLVFLFILARLLPLALLFPVLGGKVIPIRLRLGLVVVVSLMISPLFWATVDITQPTLWDVVQRTAREALFGLGLALTVTILVGALQLAGGVISQVSGVAIVDTADLGSPLGGTAIERFFALFSIAIFLSIGGHRQLVQAVLETFKWIPPGRSAPSIDSTALLVDLLTHSFELAIRASAPVVFSLVVATIVVGLIARSLPQIGVFGFGLGINLAVLLVVLWMSVESLPLLLDSHLEHGIEDALHRISHVAPGDSLPER